MAEAKGEPETFQAALKRSLRQGISSVVGADTASVVDFYVDPSLATKDIAAYTKAVERMFTVGSKLIEERCARALFFNLKLRFVENQNYKLSDYVEEARRKWLDADSRPNLQKSGATMNNQSNVTASSNLISDRARRIQNLTANSDILRGLLFVTFEIRKIP
jgi:hypothetical protein